MTIIKDNHSISSKDKILTVTEQLFSEKGYDGTRVDEIADKAGVNKALIYYYYQSKQGLLKELVKNHVAETIEFKETLLEQIDNYSEKEVKEISRRMFDFLQQKSQILSILTIETIKSSSQDKDIFELFHPVYEKTIEDLVKKGYPVDNRTKYILNLFFFGTIPVSIFIALKDKWSEFYQVDQSDMTDLFQEQMEDFYVKIYSEILKK